jgi:hypothetical protein
MEPVQWLNNREPWSTPQYIPPSPHNLPSRPDPAVAASTVQGIPADGLNVREPYRYASYNSLSLTVGTTSIKFLDAPIGKRNFLGFRNASTAAQVLYIDFNSQATTGSWLALPAGTLVVFDTVVSQDDLYVISSAAGGTLAYVYSTFPG